MDTSGLNDLIKPPRETLVLESLHFLGAGYECAGAKIPCPVPGVVCLMDILRLPWVTGGVPSDSDILAAQVLLELRRDAVGIVVNAQHAESPVEYVANHCPHEFTDHEIGVIGGSISESMKTASAGFNFFPRQNDEGEEGEMVFGAEFLAGVCRVYGDFGVPPERAIWHEPLARVGFAMATAAKANGAKNIGRENTLDWEKALKAMRNGD